MKTGSNRRVYWDTTVLIAWLNDERHWPTAVLTGIQDVVYEVENFQTTLFTSALTRTELFTGQLDDGQKQKYTKLMRRSNVEEVNAHQRITQRASLVREHYNNKRPPVKVKTPDAIHLATAIIYKADEFQTMDGLEDGGTKKTKLLALSKDSGVSGLLIVHPYPRTKVPAEAVTIKGPLFDGDKTSVQAKKRPAKWRASDGGS